MKRTLLPLLVLLALGGCFSPEEAFVRIEGPPEWEGAIVRMEGEETKLISQGTGRDRVIRSEKDLPFSPFPHQIVVSKDGFEPVHFEAVTPTDDEKLHVLQLPPARQAVPPENDRLP